MSRRAYVKQGGSLELLLDTVCNAFGGIMFITLVLVLLPTQESDVQNEDNRPTAQQIVQLQMLQAEISEKTTLLSIIEKTGKGFEDAKLNDRMRELEKLQKEKRRLENELEVRRKANNAVDSDIAKCKKQLEFMRDARNRLRKAFLKLKNRQQSRGEVRLTRLPRLRRVAKMNFFVVLKFGRIYLVNRLGRDSIVYGYNEVDFDTQRLAGGVKLTPKPSRGVDAVEWLKSARRIQEIKRVIPKERYVISIAVFRDSVKQFNRVRNAFTNAGYDYNWVPFGGQDSLQIGPSSSTYAQ